MKTGGLFPSCYFCFIDYAKAFDCVDHNKLWKILKEMGIPDHLTKKKKRVYGDSEERDKAVYNLMALIQKEVYIRKQASTRHEFILLICFAILWL